MTVAQQTHSCPLLSHLLYWSGNVTEFRPTRCEKSLEVFLRSVYCSDKRRSMWLIPLPFLFFLPEMHAWWLKLQQPLWDHRGKTKRCWEGKNTASNYLPPPELFCQKNKLLFPYASAVRFCFLHIKSNIILNNKVTFKLSLHLEHSIGPQKLWVNKLDSGKQSILEYQMTQEKSQLGMTIHF